MACISKQKPNTHYNSKTSPKKLTSNRPAPKNRKRTPTFYTYIRHIYVYTYNFPSHFTFPSYFCSQQTPVSSQQGRSNRWSKNLPRPSLIQSLLTSLHDFPVQTRCFPREGGVFFGTISHYGSMERASIFTDPWYGYVWLIFTGN